MTNKPLFPFAEAIGICEHIIVRRLGSIVDKTISGKAAAMILELAFLHAPQLIVSKDKLTITVWQKLRTAHAGNETFLFQASGEFFLHMASLGFTKNDVATFLSVGVGIDKKTLESPHSAMDEVTAATLAETGDVVNLLSSNDWYMFLIFVGFTNIAAELKKESQKNVR